MAAILPSNLLANLGLREVVPDQTAVEQWRELTLDTGGTHSTLQDIKLPEGPTAGGFCYRNTENALTRNRFIYWRVIQDVLELVEESLEFTLHSSRLRLKLQGLPILEGTTIHETKHSVIILLSTVSSVHKLVLQHPLQRSEKVSQLRGNDALPSIFTEASAQWFRHPSSYHMTNSQATVPYPYTSATCLMDTDQGEVAVFAQANEKTIHIVKFGESISTTVIQPASFATRLFGLIPSMLRSNETSDATVSVCLQSVGNDALLWALTKEGRLKAWSVLTQECKLVTDLLEQLGGGFIKQTGSQRHALRMTQNLDGVVMLAAFLSFAKHKTFLVMKPRFTEQGIQLDYLTNINGSHHYLIDFVVTSTNLFTLSSDQQGEYGLQYCNLLSKGNAYCSGFLDVIFEPPVEVDVEYNEDTTDPKEAFLSQIFRRGRFSISTLTRALQAFQQSSGASAIVPNAVYPSTGALKQVVCAAVEAEIHNRAAEYELGDEDYAQLSQSCWSQFYACIVQYHQKRPAPLGLFIDSNTGMHCLIKKGMISFLRPLDVLESLVLLRGRKWDIPPLKEFFPDSFSAGDLVESLFQVLSAIKESITQEQAARFEQELYQLESADQVAAGIAAELQQNKAFSFRHLVGSIATSGAKTCEILVTILQFLSFDIAPAGSGTGDYDEEVHCFMGSMGREVIVNSVQQMAELRLELCRNVLILQQLLVNGTEDLRLDPKWTETIRSEFIPRTVPLAHAYYAMVWLFRSPVTTVPDSLVEQNIRFMSVLGIADAHDRSAIPDSLINYFFMTEGGVTARSLAAAEMESMSSHSDWLDVMPSLVSALGQILWPLGEHVSMMKFLMTRCQPLAAQGYVRLLRNWCEWNAFSRNFLLGMAYLSSGEGDKACRCMLEAADGICREEFLARTVVRIDPEEGLSDQELMTKFYLVVIQLFEQAHLSSPILVVAQTAINNAAVDDALLSTIWSIVAKHHLKLGHNEAAYEAVIRNPDPNCRPDILRQLLNTLMERKQMDQLLQFPYEGLEAEVEHFMETRARSSDLSASRVYYAFLYAFHTQRGNMRKAASVMYEQAFRYSSEGKGLADDRQQVKCLLSCLNSLRLVRTEDSWLVQPIDVVRGVVVSKPSPTVDVVEFEDIEKEYELAFARLKLSRDSGAKQVIPFSPTEIVCLLYSSHKYETALRLALIYTIDPVPLLEHLATRCVLLARDPALEAEAWTWILETEPPEGCKASEQAWRLLEKLLLRAEKKGETRCHRAVVQRILNYDCALPLWLLASYRKKNPGELVSLYHAAGLLEDATRVAMEYVDAVLGKGKENYGLTAALHHSSPAVWLPYTVFDRLYKELDYHAKNPACLKLRDAFKEKLDFYFGTVERISREILA